MQNMKQCGYCDHTVAPNAEVCPSCGGRWPIIGRSTFRLAVERLHAFITVSGWVEPQFKEKPQTYLSMIIEMIAAIIGFTLIIGFVLALTSFLKILFTEGKSGFRSIQSVSDFFSHGLNIVLWLIVAYLLFAVGLIIFARCKSLLNKYRSGGE